MILCSALPQAQNEMLQNAVDQTSGIVVLWIADNRIRLSLLHNPAFIHDQNTAAELLYQCDIVADKQNRKAAAFLPSQLVEQRYDFFLDGHVQGGGRLVADEQLRPDGECSGNCCTLALTAADLMRVA